MTALFKEGDMMREARAFGVERERGGEKERRVKDTGS
jgi:hypothetical protein